MLAQERSHLVRRLLNLKPSIDNKAPKRYTHLQAKSTKNKEIRQREMNIENKVLLEKMMNILQRKHVQAPQAPTND